MPQRKKYPHLGISSDETYFKDLFYNRLHGKDATKKATNYKNDIESKRNRARVFGFFEIITLVDRLSMANDNAIGTLSVMYSSVETVVDSYMGKTPSEDFENLVYDTITELTTEDDIENSFAGLFQGRKEILLAFKKFNIREESYPVVTDVPQIYNFYQDLYSVYTKSDFYELNRRFQKFAAEVERHNSDFNNRTKGSDRKIDANADMIDDVGDIHEFIINEITPYVSRVGRLDNFIKLIKKTISIDTSYLDDIYKHARAGIAYCAHDLKILSKDDEKYIRDLFKYVYEVRKDQLKQAQRYVDKHLLEFIQDPVTTDEAAKEAFDKFCKGINEEYAKKTSGIDDHKKEIDHLIMTKFVDWAIDQGYSL